MPFTKLIGKVDQTNFLDSLIKQSFYFIKFSTNINYKDWIIWIDSSAKPTP